MTLRRILALALLAAAAVGAFLAFGPGGRATDGDGTAGSTALGSGASEELEPGEPGTSGRPARAPAADALVRATAAERHAVDADASPARVITVVTDLPDGTRPDSAPVAVAFDTSVGGLTALARLQSPRARGRAPRGPIAEVLLDLPASAEDEPERDLLGYAALAPDANGRWSARLEVPERAGRVFVHVLGGGLWSPRAAVVERDQHRADVPLERGGRVVVTVEGEADDDTADTLVRIATPLDFFEGGLAQPLGRFAVAVPATAEGRTPLLTVPAGVELRVRGEHRTRSCTEPARIEPLRGATTEVRLRLVRGVAVAGRVVRPDGAPAADALVHVLRPGRAFGLDDEVLRRGRTDAEGRFEIGGLDGAHFVVRAELEGFLDARAGGLEGAGDLTGLELRLGIGRSIAGRLLDGAGRGVADARIAAAVDVAYVFGPAAVTAMAGPRSGARTAEDGSFRVTGLGVGPFTVTATDADGTVLARVDDVAPGTDSLVLDARPPRAVVGTVVDETERTVADVEVRIGRVLATAVGEIHGRARGSRTDTDGAFRFEGLTEGTYDVWVRTEDYATVGALRFQIEPDALPEPLHVIAPRAARVNGRVFLPDGSAAADALVGVVDPTTPEWQPDPLAGAVVQSVRSGPDGSFSLVGLPEGHVQLRVRLEGYPTGRSDPVTVSAGQVHDGLEIRLAAGGTVEGICFDESGEVAGGRIVTAQKGGPENARSAGTDKDGTFQLSGLEPGTWHLVAIDPDRITAQDPGNVDLAAMFQNMRMATVEVREGEKAFVFLGSPETESIEVSGRVTRDGEPAAGRLLVWVRCGGEAGDRFRAATTDEDGRYEVALEASGEYIVQSSLVGVTTTDSEANDFAVRVAAGAGVVRHDIELPAGVVSGRVSTADGRPAGGVRITLLPEGPVRLGTLVAATYAESKTSPDGTFAFRTVTPGLYRVAAGGASLIGESPEAPARTSTEVFEIGAGASVEGIELALAEAGHLRVRVVDGTGAPVQGAALFLRDAAGRSTEGLSMAVTNPGGERTLHGIAAGTYTVAARTDVLASPESAPLGIVAGETAELTLVAERGTTLNIRPIGSSAADPGDVRIEVVDADGRDVSRRMCVRDMEALYATTGPLVDRRRVGPLPPGAYRVSVFGPDGEKGSKRVLLDGSEGVRETPVRIR